MCIAAVGHCFELGDTDEHELEGISVEQFRYVRAMRSRPAGPTPVDDVRRLEVPLRWRGATGWSSGQPTDVEVAGASVDVVGPSAVGASGTTATP